MNSSEKTPEVESVLGLDKQNTSWILYTLLLGGTVISFSNSALNPAIPVFMSTFNVDIVSGSWVLNAYVLAMSVGLMLTGYLSSRFQNKYLYMLSIGCFSCGSIIGALAQDMSMIIVARAIQGFSGGITIPLSVGMIYQIFPSNRHGRMMALWGIVIMMSLAFGPLVGAFLVDTFAWWTLFVCTVPLATIVIFMAWRLFPEKNDADADINKVNNKLSKSFDWLGFFGLVSWLLTFMWWINNLKLETTAEFISLLLVFVAFALLWWWYEKPNNFIKTSPKNPLFDLKLFENRVYFHSNLISISQTIALMMCLLLLPIIVQDIMSESALWTGLILMLSTLFASVTTHFAGKVVDKQGARNIGIMGIFISAISTLLFAYVLLQPTLLLVSILMILRGIGVGLAYLPTTTVGFSSLPVEKVTEAAALNNISRRIFSTILIAIATLYIDIRQKFLLIESDLVSVIYTSKTQSMQSQAIQEVFIFMAILLLLTIPSAMQLPKIRTQK